MAQARLPGKSIEEISDGVTIDGTADDITQLEDDLDTQLLAITSAFNADPHDVDYSIKVYRVVPNRAEREWLFDCTAEELPVQERVRDEYGAGQYVVWIYKNKKIFRRLGFRVGSPRVNAQPRRQGGDDTADIIRAMLEQQQKQMEQFQALTLQMMQRTAAPPVVAPAPSMVEMMTGIASLMSTMATINRPQSDGVSQLVQGITLAKELLGDNSGAGERNLNDVLAKTIDTFGPVMADAMVNRPQIPVSRQGVYMPAPRQNPSPAPAQPTNPTGERPVTEAIDKQKYLQLKMYSGILVQKAATDSDPSLYAELICDNVEDELITRYLTGPEGIDNLISVNPNVARFRPWFEKLRAEVDALLTEEADSTTLNGNEGGAGIESGADS